MPFQKTAASLFEKRMCTGQYEEQFHTKSKLPGQFQRISIMLITIHFVTFINILIQEWLKMTTFKGLTTSQSKGLIRLQESFALRKLLLVERGENQNIE